MCGNFPIPDNRSDPPRLPGNRKVGVLKIIQSLMQLLLRRSPVWNLAPSVNSTPTTRMRSSASCSPIAIIFPRKFVKTVSVVSPLVYWKTKYNKESPLLKKKLLWTVEENATICPCLTTADPSAVLMVPAEMETGLNAQRSSRPSGLTPFSTC